jgi:hypothetical protein
VGALWARRTLVSVPRLASPFIVALRERGPTVIHGRCPRSGRVSDRKTDPEICPGDHIPNTWLHAPVTGHYSPAHSPSRGRRTLAGVPPAWEEPAHGNRSGSSPWSRHVRTKLPLKVAERAGVLHFHGAGWHKGSGGACNVPLSLPAA